MGLGGQSCTAVDQEKITPLNLISALFKNFSTLFADFTRAGRDTCEEAGGRFSPMGGSHVCHVVATMDIVVCIQSVE